MLQLGGMRILIFSHESENPYHADAALVEFGLQLVTRTAPAPLYIFEETFLYSKALL